MNKLLFTWDDLTSTFWFIPVMILTVAIALAFGLLYLDSRILVGQDGIGRYIFVGSADSARSVLSTISGAMIGVAGTVFSITLVALTLASSQFGSRLVKNFMYDRLNQVVLGTYISTYIYCLIVLNSLTDIDDLLFIPAFSILFALIATVANIVLLVIFIHHIAVSIQADKVISDISASLSENIETLFPETMGEGSDEETEENEESIKSSFEKKVAVNAPKSGYLQHVDNGSLMKFAVKHDVLIELDFHPGHYLIKNVQTGTIYSNRLLEEGAVQELQGLFTVGDTRTAKQDPEYSIHQMVEIAARALSPGINDPYTAIACIDNLSSTMAHLTTVKFPSPYRYDEEGDLRIIAEFPSYEKMLDAAFNQIRQQSAGNPAVVIRLLEALNRIYSFAGESEFRDAIKKHAVMIVNMAEERFDEPNDLADLHRRSELILGDQSIPPSME